MTKVFIGIDPGLDGAMAKHDGQHAHYYIMPTIKVGGKREIDLIAVLHWFESLDADCFVAIEKVHSMPKQGVASSFTFGKGYGSLIGILVARAIPYIEVAPQTWKKAMMPDMQKNKEAAIYRIQQMHPEIALPKNKKHAVAVAEAYLMARYAQKMEG